MCCRHARLRAFGALHRDRTYRYGLALGAWAPPAVEGHPGWCVRTMRQTKWLMMVEPLQKSYSEGG